MYSLHFAFEYSVWSEAWKLVEACHHRDTSTPSELELDPTAPESSPSQVHATLAAHFSAALERISSRWEAGNHACTIHYPTLESPVKPNVDPASSADELAQSTDSVLARWRRRAEATGIVMRSAQETTTAVLDTFRHMRGDGVSYASQERSAVYFGEILMDACVRAMDSWVEEHEGGGEDMATSTAGEDTVAGRQLSADGNHHAAHSAVPEGLWSVERPLGTYGLRQETLRRRVRAGGHLRIPPTPPLRLRYMVINGIPSGALPTVTPYAMVCPCFIVSPCCVPHTAIGPLPRWLDAPSSTQCTVYTVYCRSPPFPPKIRPPKCSSPLPGAGTPFEAMLQRRVWWCCRWTVSSLETPLSVSTMHTETIRCSDWHSTHIFWRKKLYVTYTPRGCQIGGPSWPHVRLFPPVSCTQHPICRARIMFQSGD